MCHTLYHSLPKPAFLFNIFKWNMVEYIIIKININNNIHVNKITANKLTIMYFICNSISLKYFLWTLLLCFAFGYYSFVVGLSLVGYDEGAMGCQPNWDVQVAPDPWLHGHCIIFLYYELLSHYYYFSINKEAVFLKKKTFYEQLLLGSWLELK